MPFLRLKTDWALEFRRGRGHAGYKSRLVPLFCFRIHSMRFYFPLFQAFLMVCFLLSGCVTSSSERHVKASEIARANGFEETIVRTQPFAITAYSRIREPGKPLQVYIEGDGYAWVTRSRASGDPTPRKPMLLSLAAEDSSPNVVYLARPCQYTPDELRSNCREFFWTEGRFAEPVIASMDQALGSFMRKAQAPTADLIGYSGGAAVAILVAARRQDISSLRTIAGNLDPEVVSEYHGVSPLAGSLDPAAVANRIAGLPQLHFLGGEDEIIPLAATESFLKKMGDGRCFQTKTLPDATHDNGWKEAWPVLAALPVTCRE